MPKGEKIKQPTFERKVLGKEFTDSYYNTETGKYTNVERIENSMNKISKNILCQKKLKWAKFV